MGLKIVDIKMCDDNIDVQKYINNYERDHDVDLVCVFPASVSNAKLLGFVFEKRNNLL